MKTLSLMILSGLAVFGLTGCPGNANNTYSNANSRGNTAVSNANSNTAVVVNSNTNAPVSNMNAANTTGTMTSPGAFMNEAAQGGMAEVELGRMAGSKAQNSEVKAFAQKMVQDHTNANNEMKGLATKKTITLPTEVNAGQKTTAERLSKLSGAEFDREYMAVQVEDHEKMVSLFQSQADGGTDADAKAFAAKTLPNLKMHLEMARTLRGKLK